MFWVFFLIDYKRQKVNTAERTARLSELKRADAPLDSPWLSIMLVSVSGAIFTLWVTSILSCKGQWLQSWWPLTLWPYLGGYPALVIARQSLTGAQQDQAAVSLQGEQGGLLRVEDPGPHGDDLTGVLVRPGPDPRHAACKCFMLSRIISRLSSTATATASTAIQ